MAITFNGNGTVTGITTLPDGIVTNDDLAGSIADSKIVGLSANKLSGVVPTANLGSGTASSSTFLNGSGAYSAAGGGKILQCVGTSKTDTQSGNANSWVTITGLTQAITPAATSSKILVMVTLTYQGPTSNNGRFKLVRTAPTLTDIMISDASGSRLRALAMMTRDNAEGMQVAGITYLDSPNTNASVTYGIQFRATGDTMTWYVNDAQTSSDADAYNKGASAITLMEIGA